LQSLIQEKSSRVIEILLVSLRPSSLLGGKLVGLGLLILVQYLIWAVIVIAAIIVTGQDMAGILTGINISASELVLMVPYALGGFILYAGIMAGIGALSPDIEGSRLWIFLISLPMLTPLYLWAPITSDPNGALATVISLIPFSAPIAMLLRMTATIVPQWQLIVSLV
jgi:ABC-2 type transport system permease protein